MKNIKIIKLKNLFKKLFGNFHFTIWRLEGKGKNYDAILIIYYIGIEIEKNYIRQLLFKNVLVEENLGRKYVWQLFSFIKTIKPQCTLAVFECNSILQKIFKRENDFWLPQWVNGTIDLPIDITNDSAYSDCRRIRKTSLIGGKAC